jgi:N-acetylglucosamine-6-phosphate deacetylase
MSPGQTAPSGSILTPEGWVRGSVETDGARIVRIEGAPVGAGEAPPAPWILPGFIDLHVHGGGGHDWQGGEEAVRGLARFHAAHGTVALAATTATAQIPVIERALTAITAVKAERRTGEAIVLGAHLEGPFINPDKLGAQEPAALEGDPQLAAQWAERFSIRVATVAPEIPGGLSVVETLASRGTRVQIAHSLATAEQAAAGFAAGCKGFTHLFNAMSGVDHRAPGVAAYALAYGVHAEIIADLLHVDRTVLRAAARAIPKLYAVSDSTMAGLDDGLHHWGGHRVIKKGLRVTLEDGKTLAGSAITLLDAFRNLRAIGFSLDEASAMTASRQADYLGLNDLGRIAPGARACMVRLDSDLRLTGVWIDGERIEAATSTRAEMPPRPSF